MGLDQYLSVDMYISGWSHAPHSAYKKILDELEMSKYITEGAPSFTVSINVIYWRKANAIHNWFVQNVGEGVDNCQEYCVSGEALKELQMKCADALNAYNAGELDKCENILPPVNGFFFGGTDIDEYYKEDLENTILEIDKINDLIEEGYYFSYQASW